MVVDTAVFEGRSNKIGGEIVNVVRNEKDWRKMDYWCDKLLWEAKSSIDSVCRPTEFAQKMEAETDCEEESTAGKLPPGSDDEE